MSRRRGNLDAGAAHPALDASATPEAEFMNKAARDAKDPIVQAEKAEAKTKASVTELLQPFTQELETHATQPEILRARGKELLQFIFAARGLTKSGNSKEIFAGRKALAAAEQTLKDYQRALAAAKTEPLNPAKDYTHDTEKMNELTRAIRGIVPKEFTSTGFWKGEPFGAHLRMSAEADPQPSREPKPAAKAGDTKTADELNTKRAMLEIETRKKLAEEQARTQENIIRQETSEAGLTPGERAELEAKKKKPLRLEHGIRPLPDSAIGDIEEGSPPVRDEIPSLEPALPEGVEDGRDDWILDEADVDPSVPPRRFDLDELGTNKDRLAEHRSPLSDEELLSDSNAAALAEASKRDKIINHIIALVEQGEQQRLTRPPEHARENILNEKELQDLQLATLIDEIRDRIQRLKVEYDSIVTTWFSRGKKERKRQLKETLRANQKLLRDSWKLRRSLEQGGSFEEFNRLLDEDDKQTLRDMALNREPEEAHRRER